MSSHRLREAGATRRKVLVGVSAAALVGSIGVGRSARAQATADYAAAFKKATNGAQPQEGKVVIAAAEIAENGATVPVTVKVDMPISAQSFVKQITLLADGNPNPEVAVFHLGPRAGRAEVSTRVRLAKTENLVAVAELSDGSLWSAHKEIKVTIGGCGG